MKYKDKIINLFTAYCKENNKIEIYDDYRDHENPEYMLYHDRYFKNSYGESKRIREKITNRDDFISEILDAYSDSESYYIDDMIKDFKNNYIKDYRLVAYLDYHDDLYDNLRDVIYDYVDIEYPINSFLNDRIKVNIFYKSKTNSGYDDEWLPWLLHTQGFLCKDHPYLKKLLNRLHVYHSEITKKDKELYNKDYKENIFLKSLIDEIENCYLDSPRDLCFIAEISIKDYFNLLEKNKEFFINKDAMVGLVDYYNGGGSLLDIQLQKDIKLNTNNVKILVEKIDKYTVDEIYGLIGSCFRDCVKITSSFIKEGNKKYVN